MNTVKTIQQRGTTGYFGASDQEIDAAGYYEEKFVPSLFQPWVSQLVDAAAVEPAHRVLDVACGTGVVARAIADLVEPVPVGLDISAGMLTVASRISPGFEWHLGSADALPFADASFDRVLCQFGLMFFDDPVAALLEMRRVLKPGGRLAVAVWDSLEANPGFATKVEILQRTAGQAAADALRAPFRLGDRLALIEMARAAGIGESSVVTREAGARFGRIEDFVEAELCGWLPVMGVILDAAEIDQIQCLCRREMGAYQESGGFVLPTSAHILGGTG